MEADFWHDKWERKEIGFHQPEVSPSLHKHISALGLTKGAHIFVPLCGKTLDIHWLLDQGFHVHGAELSEIAVKELFEEMGLTPTITRESSLTHYQAQGVDIWAGDIFDLTADKLGDIDGIFDRAALVALPADIRNRYVRHLETLTGHAPQLLICYEYDQSQMDGPPFSIDELLVHTLYDGSYSLTLLETLDLDVPLKTLDTAKESVWLLTNK